MLWAIPLICTRIYITKIFEIQTTILFLMIILHTVDYLLFQVYNLSLHAFGGIFIFTLYAKMQIFKMKLEEERKLSTGNQESQANNL